MTGQVQRSSSWTGRIVVLAVALLESQLHVIGAPERALAARLLGRNIGLIRSDRGAMFVLLFMLDPCGRTSSTSIIA